MSKIAIIASGFSGLRAAAYLTAAGHEVHVFEKNTSLGAKARQLKTDSGYLFDMGPSWYWMPDVFEKFFSDFGYSVSDFNELKPFAMKLGAAFQKINFLRDMKADYQILGRTYFPNVDMRSFSSSTKRKIENEIEQDFKEALIVIKKLPSSAKGGVYLAYVYYNSLFKKIKKVPAQKILSERIRISNGEKFGLMLNSMFQYKMNLL